MRARLSASLILVLAAGCSTTSNKTSTPNHVDLARVGHVAQRIQNGDDDTTDRFSVGVCIGTPGHCSEICSGALILPNLVVTARHCVSESPEQIDCLANPAPAFGKDRSGFVVTTNDSMANPGPAGWYNVASVARPTDAHLCGNDIALITLQTPIPATDAKPVTPAVQYALWDPAANNDFGELIAIGHGAAAPDGGGVGLRRKSNTDVPIPTLCIPGAPTLPCPQEQLTTDNEFYGGDGICQGDSGGGAYDAKKMSGSPVVFGVLSRGGGEDTDQCTQSVYTRLDLQRDFILATAKVASQGWALYPEPSWTAFKAFPASVDAGVAPKVHSTGDACAVDTDCLSGLCADPKNGPKLCSAECAKNEDCPDGLVCRGISAGDKQLLCLKAGSPVAAAKDDDGCSTATGSASATPGLLFLAAITAFFVKRRRPRT